MLDLVMSDEFTVDGRSFAKGDDEVFEAQERPDDINQGIAYCESPTSQLDNSIFIYSTVQRELVLNLDRYCDATSFVLLHH